MSRKRREAAAREATPSPDSSSSATAAAAPPNPPPPALLLAARFAPLLPFSLLAAGLLLTRFRPFEEPDLWWHLSVGRDLLAGKGIPDGDLYTWSLPGHRWVDHEWLLDLLLGKMVEPRGGTVAPALLFLALTVAALGVTLLPRRGRPVAGAPFAAAAVALGAWVAGTGVGIRPTVVSLLFLAILWWWIRDADWASRRTAWIVPLLFVPWANLHGGFVVALALLGLDAALARWRGDLDGFRRRLILLGGSFVATLVNPYGLRLYHEAAVVFFDSYAHRTIAEWQPPVFGDPLWRPLYLFQGLTVAALVAGLAIRKGRERLVSPLEAATLALFLVLANRSIRHAPLLVVLALPVIAGVAATAAQRFAPLARRTLPALLVVLLALGAAFPAARWAAPRRAGFLAANTTGVFAGYPAEAVDFMVENGIPFERTVADYGWGGFLPWYEPSAKVFIDGRMASWNAPTPWGGAADGPHILREYHAMSGDPAARERLLGKWKVRYFLGSRAAFDAAGASTSSPDVVYAGATAVLIDLAPESAESGAGVDDAAAMM